MPEILSSKEKAEKIATKLNLNLQSLEREFNCNIDNRTTVLGNGKAHELYNSEKNIVRGFVGALKKDIDNIKKVVNEFETLDEKIKQEFLK
ncbi:TIGR04197 family type VII secretion effector [Clostridium sporogenes]|uniref:TIGR04197 family type VII secretion effector n=1 Tax=Clostridium sporogenes TaxID=1509 RepID=UPI002902E5BD|nr:TIGR04197 family type VII secretion effector [Clostridium botulinum]